MRFHKRSIAVGGRGWAGADTREGYVFGRGVDDDGTREGVRHLFAGLFPCETVLDQVQWADLPWCGRLWEWGKGSEDALWACQEWGISASEGETLKVITLINLITRDAIHWLHSGDVRLTERKDFSHASAKCREKLRLKANAEKLRLTKATGASWFG